jgi:hypothetical protein
MTDEEKDQMVLDGIPKIKEGLALVAKGFTLVAATIGKLEAAGVDLGPLDAETIAPLTRTLHTAIDELEKAFTNNSEKSL